MEYGRIKEQICNLETLCQGEIVMSEMIINQNTCGLYFDAEDLQWDLKVKASSKLNDDDDVSYDDIEHALNRGDEVERISVHSVDYGNVIWDVDGFEWDLNWEIKVAYDMATNSYVIRTDIDATPNEVADELSELNDDRDDFEELYALLCNELDTDKHIELSCYDWCLEGDYSEMFFEQYRTFAEAFERIPVALDRIYRFLNAKGKIFTALIEHYEEN